jgi:hypothetical protein
MALSDYAPFHPDIPEAELAPTKRLNDTEIIHPEASDILPKVRLSSCIPD